MPTSPSNSLLAKALWHKALAHVHHMRYDFAECFDETMETSLSPPLVMLLQESLQMHSHSYIITWLSHTGLLHTFTAIVQPCKALVTACARPALASNRTSEQTSRTSKRDGKNQSRSRSGRPGPSTARTDLHKKFWQFRTSCWHRHMVPQNHSKPKTKDALPSFEPASPMPPLQPAE